MRNLNEREVEGRGRGGGESRLIGAVYSFYDAVTVWLI